MARFYADIRGARGGASRCGSAGSGIASHTRGWNIGARVSVGVGSDGKDIVTVWITSGSSGRGGDTCLGEFREGGAAVSECHCKGRGCLLCGS